MTTNEPKKFKDEQEKKKIIDRIRKILAVANGTTYEGEANTAMSMAQNYMKTYGLSMNEVEIGEALDEQIVHEDVDRKQTPKTWERMLAQAIGIVTDCKAINNYKSKGSVMSFLGYKTDVDFAKLLFIMLRNASRSTAHKLFPEDSKLRNSFYLGLAYRLIERAQAEKQKDTVESKGYGLIVQEKSNRIEIYAQEKMNLKKSPIKSSKINVNAYDRGKQHANSIDLMNREKVAKQTGLQIGYTK